MVLFWKQCRREGGRKGREREGEIWNKGGMEEEEWSEAGTNDGCAQGHTSTAVSPPNFSNVRSA